MQRKRGEDATDLSDIISNSGGKKRKIKEDSR